MQIAGLVVDQIIRAKDGFVAAEDIVSGQYEGKMPLQPAIFGPQRVGNNHSLRGNKNLKAPGKRLEHLLSARHQRKILEEVLSVKESAQLLLAFERRHFPQPLSLIHISEPTRQAEI